MSSASNRPDRLHFRPPDALTDAWRLLRAAALSPVVVETAGVVACGAMDAMGIDVIFAGGRTEWQAGEELEAEVRLRASPDEKIGPVEVSVLWQTEGKGNTDSDIAWFGRFEDDGSVERRIPLRVPLPLLPRTYLGVNLKILWLVRVRCLWALGNDLVLDHPFTVR